MQNDRELLEMAAKAAGYALGQHSQKDYAFTYGGKEWNPLTDDGDAMRLAVKLQISIINNDIAAWVAIGDTQLVRAEELYDNDPYAATRRAIVRAAAEIGRGLTDEEVEEFECADVLSVRAIEAKLKEKNNG